MPIQEQYKRFGNDHLLLSDGHKPFIDEGMVQATIISFVFGHDNVYELGEGIAHMR